MRAACEIGVSSDADARVATQANKRIESRIVISENDRYCCNLGKVCEFGLSVKSGGNGR